MAPRGVSRAELFRKNAFVASCARQREGREKGTFEKHLVFLWTRPRARPRGGGKKYENAPRALFLLKKWPCDRGRRRNRVVGLRGVALSSCARPGGATWQTLRFPPTLTLGGKSDQGRPRLGPGKKYFRFWPFARGENAKFQKTPLFLANRIRSAKRVFGGSCEKRVTR